MNAKSSTNAGKSPRARKAGSTAKPAAKKAASAKLRPPRAQSPLQERIKKRRSSRLSIASMLRARRAGKSRSRGKTLALAAASGGADAQRQFSRYLHQGDFREAGRSRSSLTLKWTGPQAAGQDSGPFRSSPARGMKGLNCDLVATSRRSGSKCTPKGTFAVSGFQSRLNSDSRATYVTWFVRARGIALHYFPSVPKYAASHGCVRLEKKSVAQLIQSNSRIGLTNVVIDGTWTKPAKQW